MSLTHEQQKKRARDEALSHQQSSTVDGSPGREFAPDSAKPKHLDPTGILSDEGYVEGGTNSREYAEYKKSGKLPKDFGKRPFIPD